jgi:hypothetical protein
MEPQTNRRHRTTPNKFISFLCFGALCASPALAVDIDTEKIKDTSLQVWETSRDTVGEVSTQAAEVWKDSAPMREKLSEKAAVGWEKTKEWTGDTYDVLQENAGEGSAKAKDWWKEYQSDNGARESETSAEMEVPEAVKNFWERTKAGAGKLVDSAQETAAEL